MPYNFAGFIRERDGLMLSALTDIKVNIINCRKISSVSGAL